MCTLSEQYLRGESVRQQTFIVVSEEQETSFSPTIMASLTFTIKKSLNNIKHPAMLLFHLQTEIKCWFQTPKEVSLNTLPPPSQISRHIRTQITTSPKACYYSSLQVRCFVLKKNNKASSKYAKQKKFEVPL
jgi:hypothetical protein